MTCRPLVAAKFDIHAKRLRLRSSNLTGPFCGSSKMNTTIDIMYVVALDRVRPDLAVSCTAMRDHTTR